MKTIWESKFTDQAMIQRTCGFLSANLILRLKIKRSSQKTIFIHRTWQPFQSTKTIRSGTIDRYDKQTVTNIPSPSTKQPINQPTPPRSFTYQLLHKSGSITAIPQPHHSPTRSKQAEAGTRHTAAVAFSLDY